MTKIWYPVKIRFIFHTVKMSLPDFLDKLFTHFKGQWRIVLIKFYMPNIAITFRIQINATYFLYFLTTIRMCIRSIFYYTGFSE